MAICSYCGTKLDDNAKFCTACGAAVEQTAPAQEAPAQGSYTAPQQGSYTAPTQGTYTPAQSYTPPAQPTSAAADSGSYTPPVQNSVPGGNYEPKAKAKIKMPGMPQMPKAPAGKKRFAAIAGIANGIAGAGGGLFLPFTVTLLSPFSIVISERSLLRTISASFSIASILI